MSEGVGELTLQGLLDAVGARTTAPGGGVVTGVVAALAGALAAMSARFSEDDLPGLAARAEQLRARAASLAQSDPAVYAAYLQARRVGRDGSEEVTAALDEAIRVPLEMAEVAAEIAELARRLARSGNPRLRGDATAAVLMGAAATRAGAVLVCGNLVGTGRDPRRARRGSRRISRRRRA
jgi:formiminotetrahydrofolate cyclodeaminase